MKRTSFLTTSTMRVAAIAAACSAIGLASADLKFTVSVNSNGSSAHGQGIPQSGNYEVDFQATKARVVEPDGTILLFSFKSSQVWVLNSEHRTFTKQTLKETVQPAHQELSIANLSADNSTGSQPMFGETAYKYSISSKGSATTTEGHMSQLSGDGWFVDGSAMKESIGSIAPFTLIAAPSFLVSSLTDQLDALAGIPMSVSLSWINRDKSTGSTDMVVTAAESVTLATTLFEVPKQYQLSGR